MSNIVVIILKTQMKNDCQKKQTWSEIIDCLKCPNSDYRIVDYYGTLLKNFNYPNSIYKNQIILCRGYVIKLFENVKVEDIDSYILNLENNYQVISLDDNSILKEARILEEHTTVFQKIKRKLKK